VGHVLQDKNHFWLLNAVVNVARLNRLAGNLTIPTLLTGFILDFTLLILFGYCLFFISAICNILIYYLNSDASKRGEAWLRRGKLISKEEDKLVRKFLTSANMSYLGGIVIAPFEVFFTLGRMLSKPTFSRSKEEALRPRTARKS
jgi:Zn-dependent membrane protease YugP